MASKELIISVRSATEGDLPAMTTLCEQLGYPVAQQILVRRLEILFSDLSDTILVAVNHHNKAIGFIHAQVRHLLIVDEHIEIGGLVVDKAYRGNRIGEILLNEIENWARSNDIPTIFVRSNIIREDAHRFYERLGYHITKTSLSFQKQLGPVENR